MKKNHKLIILSILFALSISVFSQDKEYSFIETVTQSSAFLFGSANELNKKYPVGSGFFVSDNGLIYLITAAHHADSISKSKTSYIRYINQSGGISEFEKVEFSNHEWYYNEESDLAILPMKRSGVLFSEFPIGISSIAIYNEKKAPLRNETTYTIGYPDGLGRFKMEPITLSGRPASKLIQYRLDSLKIYTGYYLDSNSFGGNSGGPVVTVDTSGKLKELVGVVSGSNTKLNLAVIAPSYSIMETIKRIPKYSDTLRISYDNGKPFTSIIYQENKIMEVQYIKSSTGIDLDKGNLRYGNGELLQYEYLNEKPVQKLIIKNGEIVSVQRIN
ncbi:S1 family peptidase [Lentiprolixibacter aurantiacus]|uniref:Serine protease n=1 Tax=Lentiprolixibacter aurantiacus TaxID=2993939 RepID=A0AAE3MKK6_9FLAO|nr:serine protease [Lentiprolixibacter aurantiacus]MCX2718762.1 serine protease [Lentiprolixibacter aurantiacus]